MTAWFSGGADFISDANDPLAAAIQAALEAKGSLGPAVEFGACALPDGSTSLIYLRIASADGNFFTHAVTYPGGAGTPPAYRIERAFAKKYGEPVGPRARELMMRLSEVTVSQAMLTLTDVFLDGTCLEDLERDSESAATAASLPAIELTPSQRAQESMRNFNPTLPWLIATASIGVAGFLAGQLYPIGLPPVSAGLPSLPVEFEITDDEQPEALGPAEMPLASQIEFERRGHAEALAELQAEVDRLNQQLGVREPESAIEPTDAEDSTAPRTAAPVPSEFLAGEGESAFATVNADILWVRAGPGSEHAKLVRLERDAAVELAGSSEGEWSHIVRPRQGWVATRFLQTATEQEPPIDAR
jgi:hypothetical protein